MMVWKWGKLINLDQINQYFKQLIKSENMLEISLVNQDKLVILTTNKNIKTNDSIPLIIRL